MSGKQLVLIRGIPGSGKSTMARSLMAERHSEGSWKHYEADMWMVDNEGFYRFDPKRLSYCHSECLDATSWSLQCGYNVVVSNTFVRAWEVERYWRVGLKHGARIEIIEAKGDFPNVHGVPAHKVSQMRWRYETLSAEDFKCPTA